MKFIERGLYDVLPEARTELGEKLGENRAPGLHLSHITNEMRRAADLPGDIPGEQPGIRMQMGFLWEHALRLVASGVPVGDAMEMSYKRWMLMARSGVVQQITGERDGIHMTPDGLDCNEGVMDSYKYTYKSMAKADSQVEFEENFWPWLVAEKGYAWAWGVDTTRFFICWDRGDYTFKPGRGGPQVRIYDCVYTQQELEDNWAAVLAYKQVVLDKWKKEGKRA